jgi:hypothetical protein
VPPVASKVAVAVAGSASISSENLDDLLADWLMLGTEEEREFRFFLPADEALSTPVVNDTSEWIDSIDAGYIAVTGKISTSRRRGAQQNLAADIKQYAQDVILVRDDETVIEKLISSLTAAEEVDGFTPHLLLAWGDEPDELTEELAGRALDAGIKVLDLTAGLDDLGWSEEEEPEELAEEEPVQETIQDAIDQQEAEDKVDWPDEPVDEAQAMIRQPVEPPMPDLATTLAFVYQRLDFEDRANAANNMMTHYNRPLTLAVRHHLHAAVGDELAAASVDAAKAAETVSKPVSEPTEESAKPRRGTPRDTASDIVKVLINENAGTIRLAPARGRYKKDEVAHEMPRSEYEELLKSDKYTLF